MNASIMHIRTHINLSFAFIFFLINIAMWCLVPLGLAQHTSLIVINVIAVIATNPYWALLHEGIHRIFHPNKKVNDLACRGISLSFGTVFFIVRYGHLMHHRMNRQGPDLIDAYHPQTEKRWKKNVHYFSYILGGLYLSEVFSPLLVFLPKRLLTTLLKRVLGSESPYYQVACSSLLKAKTLWQCRIDALLLYALFALSFWLYGHLWWVLLATLLARGFLISFADNLPHYGTVLDKPLYALNTRMPRYLGVSLFHFNLHRIHHEHPTLPWSALPQKLQTKGDQCDIGYFTQALRQFKGVWPIDQTY